MKKLLLINPVNKARVGFTINKSSIFPPIGLGIIAALTPDNWAVEILDENFVEFQYQEADLVGITAFTASANRAYEIAKLYRNKKIPVIMGGIHASLQTEEAIQYVDSVVIGEAEGVWNQVIKDYESNNLQKIYTSEKIDLSKMPIARHDLFNKDYMFGSIQTTRGCPMDCEFCSVTSFNGSTYRQRPIKNVLDEMEKIQQENFFIVDDNIIGHSKASSKHALDLFKGIIDRGIKKEWFCQASLNFADNEEILQYAAKAGCRMVFIGLESENVKSLKDANKNLNLKMGVDSYENAFKTINKHGIAVLGAFIYGFDTDDSDALDNRTEYIINSGVDVVQKTFLTPFPGTRLFTKLLNEGRLLHTKFPADWNFYDMTTVVFKPKLMEVRELYLCMRKCSISISKVIEKKFHKTLFATKDYKTAMWALNWNINYQNIWKAQSLPIKLSKEPKIMSQAIQIKKTVIFTDYNCNNNCIFCIDKNKRLLKGKDLNEIKKEIEEARDRGTTYLEFIGGEVTIRKDSLDIFSFAKLVGFKTIALVTNGRMLAYEDYAKKLINSGITHIVLSFHGHNKELHDSLTMSEGSFEQMVKGLKNLRKFGFDNFGTNTTIVKQNYKQLPEIGRFLLENKLYNCEFIFVDPNYGAAKDDFDDLVPRISEIAPYVKKCLDIGRADKKVNHWHIRYVPLCYFEDYLDNVSELEEVSKFKTEHIAPDFQNYSVESSRASVGRIKTEKCQECKLFNICEGIWKEYINQYGDNELIPVN